MNQIKTVTKDISNQVQQPTCNVNMTFNFTVGGLAIAAMLLIGYLVYAYWLK